MDVVERGPALIDVQPLVWTEWSSSEPNAIHGYIIRPYSTSRGTVCHWLTELGQNTSNYRYAVYYRHNLLMGKVIRLECCSGLKKCPIKHYQLPLSPCREYMRARAIEEAQQVWVEFIRSITDNKCQYK